MIPRQQFARVIQPLISPDVFDFWAARLNPTLSWNRPLARVVERRVESKDTVTLVLAPNRHLRGFLPGQHINVTVEVNGIRLTRSYSPSKVAGHPRQLAITIKQIANGKISTQLCQYTQVGDVVELGAAFGEMTLQPALADKWLFLAAGSGITPLVSLIRQLARTPFEQDVTLIYWARTREELCFANELKSLAQREGRFHVHFVLTQETQLLPGEFTGRPDEALLKGLIPDVSNQAVYACGPAGFVDTVRTLLAGQVKHFQAEAFTPPVISTEVSGTMQVHLAASNRTLELPAGQPLLKALEEQGFQPKYGCRMGICNTCACGKLEGTTRNLLSGETEVEPLAALRLCVSSALTDLTLDL